MRIERILEAKISCDDIISYATKGEIDKLVEDKLNEKFLGKCFDGCYIHRIKSFTRSRGHIELYSSNKVSTGISVEFVAECEVIEVGEYIPDCIIENISPHIQLKNSTSIAVLVKHPRLESFKPGQYIPITAVTVSYPPLKPRVIINAVPYVYETKDTKYLVVPHPPTKIKYMVDDVEPSIELFKLMVIEIEKVSKELSELDQSKVTFFSKVFSQKGITKVDGVDFLQDAKAIVAGGKLEATKFKPGSVIIQPVLSNQMYPVVTTEEKEKPDEKYIVMDIVGIMPLLLTKHLSFLKMVLFYSKTFAIEEFKQKYENLILLLKGPNGMKELNE